MSSSPSHVVAQAGDWFLPAITAAGSVFDSFQAVQAELSHKLGFTQALLTSLCAAKSDRADRVSELNAKVKKFQATLQFRLGMLAPTRPGAWFRENMNQAKSPFGTQILSEPVLAPYDINRLDDIRAALRESFLSGRIVAIPFNAYDACLWLTLLTLNQDWHTIDRLPAPFEKLYLSRMPGGLPAELQSPALHAFLGKVNAVFNQTKAELDDAYKKLWEACEAFWREQRRTIQGATARAEKRRKRPPIKEKPVYAMQDYRALQFMSFAELPDRSMLKKRYRDLALAYHPDVQGGSEEKFLRLKQCYQHLIKRLDDLGSV